MNPSALAQVYPDCPELPLTLLGNAGGSEASVAKIVVDDPVPVLVLHPNGVRSSSYRIFQNTNEFPKCLVRFVGIFLACHDHFPFLPCFPLAFVATNPDSSPSWK